MSVILSRSEAQSERRLSTSSSIRDVFHLMRFDDVQQFGLRFIGKTHAQSLSGHTQLIDGRHMIPKHHPVLMQHLRRDRGSFHYRYCVSDISALNSCKIQRRMHSFFFQLFIFKHNLFQKPQMGSNCVCTPCTLSSSSQTAPWKCCPPPPALGPCASTWRRTGWLSECAQSHWLPTDLGWWWGDGRPPARLHPRSFLQRWPSDLLPCQGNFLIGQWLKFQCSLSDSPVLNAALLTCEKTASTHNLWKVHPLCKKHN